jgi:hypothetical protein
MLGPCESLLPYAVDFLLSGVWWRPGPADLAQFDSGGPGGGSGFVVGLPSSHSLPEALDLTAVGFISDAVLLAARNFSDIGLSPWPLWGTNFPPKSAPQVKAWTLLRGNETVKDMKVLVTAQVRAQKLFDFRNSWVRPR